MLQETGLKGAEVEVLVPGSSWWGIVWGRYTSGRYLVVPATSVSSRVVDPDRMILIGNTPTD